MKAKEIFESANEYEYDSYEALEQLSRKSNKGWIKPDGKVIIVRNWEHLDKILENNYFPELKNMLEKLEEIQNDERHELEYERSQDPDDDGNVKKHFVRLYL